MEGLRKGSRWENGYLSLSGSDRAQDEHVSSGSAGESLFFLRKGLSWQRRNCG